MGVVEFNKLVADTLGVGNRLIFESFNENDFILLQRNLNKIVRNGYGLLTERVQLQTCYNIALLKIDSFKLSWIEQLFFSDGKGTYGSVNSKNTDEQLKKRYVLHVTRCVPILEINEM